MGETAKSMQRVLQAWPLSSTCVSLRYVARLWLALGKTLDKDDGWRKMAMLAAIAAIHHKGSPFSTKQTVLLSDIGRTRRNSKRSMLGRIVKHYAKDRKAESVVEAGISAPSGQMTSAPDGVMTTWARAISIQRSSEVTTACRR